MSLAKCDDCGSQLNTEIDTVEYVDGVILCIDCYLKRLEFN
jgi:formylmethanofuran dehydrogenase subunit E